MLSDVVGAKVLDLRKSQGLTRAQLAKRCADLGSVGITAANLSNIETGRPDKDGTRRRHITIDELLVLAKALHVPPLLLMFPLDETAAEPLPGAYMHPWNAAKWFTAEGPFFTADATRVTDDDAKAWQIGGAVLHLLREHDEMVRAWRKTSQEIERSEKAGEHEMKGLTPQQLERLQNMNRTQLETFTRHRDTLESQIEYVRRQLRHYTDNLPALPNELARLTDVGTMAYSLRNAMALDELETFAAQRPPFHSSGGQA